MCYDSYPAHIYLFRALYSEPVREKVFPNSIVATVPRFFFTARPRQAP